MRISSLAIAAASAALLATSLSAPALADNEEQNLRERIIERLANRSDGERRGRMRAEREPAPPADLVFDYAPGELHSIGFYHADNAAAPAPLVLFVHGGGWRQGNRINATGAHKSGHFTAQNYHFASIDYGLIPETPVEEQAHDVARAIKALIDRADELKIDRERIVLMGHSAGAHLISLVSTDPQYLAAQGLTHSDILAAIPIDGAAYHVPEQMRGQRRLLRNMYEDAFGEDRERQRALSPTLHTAQPNVDNFLFLNVQREDGIAQANQLSERLTAAGSHSRVELFEGEGLRGHAEINMEMGNPDYAATPVVDAYLRDIFGS